MSVEEFSLRRTEQMNQQQSSEGVRVEEPQAAQTPESETEQVEQQVEQKEGKENLKAKYDRLAQEAGEIQRERELTFAVSSLQSEGFQTLLAEYGVDAVLNTTKKEQGNRKSRATTFEVIRALEPDKTKRFALYAKMVSDQQKEAEQIEQQQQQEMKKGDGNSFSYFSSAHANVGNFVRGVQFRVEAMKNLDSVLGKIGSERQYRVLNSGMAGFNVFGSEDDEVKFKQELEQAGNNIFNLTEQRSKAIGTRTEKLRAESDKLIDELTAEIQLITTELNTKLEEYRARVVSDISKVGNLETISEEMRTVLQGVLSKVEGEIITHVQATEKEIAEKTAPLRQMMDSVANLHRI